jgi:RNA-directed DNA polymerase
MNYNTYEKLFREKAVDSGYSEANILKCLDYAKVLIDRKLPVIYNSSNLAALVGYKRAYIKRAVHHPSYFYREFCIRKKNGKLRKIAEPLPSLKDIQMWILSTILYSVKNNKFSKAYTPKRTIIDNVKFHINQTKVICLDIKDFFTSIKENHVTSIFMNFGYSKRVSIVLSKLCCLNGCLPQGAPTSPQLSNIYMNNFDKEISKYCISKKIRYTRYADDITFSGDFDEKELFAFLKEQISIIEFTINPNKTKIMTKNMRQIVTGIVVNKAPQVPKEKRKEIRQSIYYIRQFGLNNHLERINCAKANYLKHLLGIVNYVLFVNPLDQEMIEYKKYLFLLIKEI